MYRVVRNILLLAVVAGLTTIAVAWACALWSHPSRAIEGRVPTREEVEFWRAQAPATWLFEPRAYLRHQGWGITQTTIANPPGEVLFIELPGDRIVLGSRLRGVPSPGTGNEQVIILHAGWPLRCLEGLKWGPIRATSWRTGNSGTHFVSALPADAVSTGKYLPLKPLFGGFAVNVVFYAACLGIPLAGFRATRAYLRVRAGRCPRCSYPFSSSSVCSECGKPLARHSRRVC